MQHSSPLTSGLSYGRKYRLAIYPTFNPKEKDHAIVVIHQPKTVPTPLLNSLPELRPLEDLSAERGRLSFVLKNEIPRRLYLDIPLQNDLSRGNNLDIRYPRHQEDTKMQRGKPVKELISIKVYPGKENKTVRIGSNLKEDTKLELVNLLRTYADVFAWTAADMPGIDPEVITHRLNVDPSRKPVKQKNRTFAPERQEKIEEETPHQLGIYEVSDPWNLYVDGSSAIGSSGAEIILISPEGVVVEYALRFGFQASNTEAEYEALLAGIRLAHALKVDSLSVHSDSQLVVNHVLGDQNTQADTLSRLASAKVIDVRPSVYLEFLKDRSITSQTEIGMIDQEPCWMDMIVKILVQDELPSERHGVRNLCVKAARYALVDGVLYKKSFSLPYLRCLCPSESLYALQEVHEGICGQHLGGRTLAQKILKQGYYWPTIQKDAIEFTQRCDKCQKFALVTHTSVAPLTSVVSPIPFAIWGMDLLGPFPMASGQQRLVIVAIDYFTKWTEAEFLATITSAKCEDFFWKNVVCRFGVPRALVIDNGKQFDNNF
ncbi:hypothetical protein RJ639_020313 [Escallonia herrerae]|uniref:Integrase catalytic domain-containing protein n=1 Tax=Escallonia herrerae TaxID=1293975 RepID=A0AA89AGF2_9ASTE|nr:hypothetical protein RJ639_020313 [Escallonia herrerae]